MCPPLQCRRYGFHPWVRKFPWRRKRQPTPVFLPGEFHGQRSLLGYSPLSHNKLDMTKQLTPSTTLLKIKVQEYMQNRKRDTDIQNRILDSVGDGEGGMFQENSIKTCILSRVKQITSPGWIHETNARAWCTGKTQRNRRRGRWEGGSGWGIHVNPWLIHVNV